MEHIKESNEVAPPPQSTIINSPPPRISEPVRTTHLTAPPRNRHGLLSGFFWFFATSMLVFSAWFVGPLVVEKYQYAATKGRVEAEYENAARLLQSKPLEGVSQAYQLVAQKIRPSVVSINAHSKSGGGGQGSGVILSADGYVITNEHVVKDAYQVDVILHDRKKYSARIVGTDYLNDLAVLKIGAPDLIAAEWGDSEALRVGSMLWAVGSPYGLEQTITSGILSAKDRSQQRSAQEFLQTDAAVNPGNSGGPLVNAQGQVVGINTSIFGDQFQGISFAVPSCVAKFVFEEIIEKGKVQRGYLGVLPEAVMHRDMMRLDLPDLNGAKIRQVTENSPAEKSGLRRNDVIRCWNGNNIVAYSNLYRYIAMTEPDSSAEVDIIRGGKEMTLQVCVEERPEEISIENIPSRRN